MSLDNPALSIITPMFNAGAMFETFMQSLLAQSLTDLEIIIVDDGSTDGSGERAEAYAQQHPHVQVIHQANGGVSRARNAGLAAAKGKYVTIWMPHSAMRNGFSKPARKPNR